MKSFVLTLHGGVPGDAIKIMSTLDKSVTLAARSVERVMIGDDDVWVIKNRAETPARLTVAGESDMSGRAIFRPSRQQSFLVWRDRAVDFELAGGESCVIESELAQRLRRTTGRANPSEV